MLDRDDAVSAPVSLPVQLLIIDRHCLEMKMIMLKKKIIPILSFVFKTFGVANINSCKNLNRAQKASNHIQRIGLCKILTNFQLNSDPLHKIGNKFACKITF